MDNHDKQEDTPGTEGVDHVEKAASQGETYPPQEIDQVFPLNEGDLIDFSLTKTGRVSPPITPPPMQQIPAGEIARLLKEFDNTSFTFAPAPASPLPPFVRNTPITEEEFKKQLSPSPEPLKDYTGQIINTLQCDNPLCLSYRVFSFSFMVREALFTIATYTISLSKKEFLRLTRGGTFTVEGSSHLTFSLCFDCGKIQGKFPAYITQLETDLQAPPF